MSFLPPKAVSQIKHFVKITFLIIKKNLVINIWCNYGWRYQLLDPQDNQICFSGKQAFFGTMQPFVVGIDKGTPKEDGKH